MSQPKFALFSVSNKTGIVEFAQELVKLGWRILASGGTANTLRAGCVSVTSVKDMVEGVYRQRLERIGIPADLINHMIEADAFCSGAILKHRVATLRPEVHGGLISDFQDEAQAQQLADFLIPVIDMLVCDFYPLSAEIAKAGATVESVVEQTDIGGPTMVRSAAKGGRIVICRFEDRQMVLNEMLMWGGQVSAATRQVLRARAEFEVAKYVMESARFHSNGDFDAIMGEKVRGLAYGENKDQSPADLFACDSQNPLSMSHFQVLAGDPSYISIADGDRAIGVMRALVESLIVNREGLRVPYIAVACKHGTPCGIGVSYSKEVALSCALLGDHVAVMGAELVVNFPIDEELGKDIYEVSTEYRPRIGRQYWGTDVLYAPAVDPATVELLGKKEKRRILVNPALSAFGPAAAGMMYRPLSEGGFLRQKRYHYALDLKNLAKQTGNLSDRIFDVIIAWAAAWRSVSNTVAIANNGMLIGLGAGQQDRMHCVKLCLDRAERSGHDTRGASFGSDGFFPYAQRTQPDMPLEGPELLVRAYCKAGVVPYDGKNVAEVEEYFRQSGVAVAFVPPEHRGFFGH